MPDNRKDRTMATTSNVRLFGLSNYGVVQGTRFACGVSIAPEGLFKGYSLVVSYFDPKLTWQQAYESGQLKHWTKALLHPTMTKAGRKHICDTLVQQLDTPDGQELGFALAVYVNFMILKEEGLVVDFMLHPVVQQLVDKEIAENQPAKAA
jgi:hypothetical protein